MLKNVLVTGGAGYVGTVLVPQLLAAGHTVTVYDAMFYGCELAPRPGLTLLEADIRDTSEFREACTGVDAVIHLACISNDAGFELDERVSEQINYHCFEPLVRAAKEQRVRRFIYASSSSVYGVSDSPRVTEEHPLVPLTLYNKFKGLCEPLLFKHQSADFVCVTIRPATVCGYSPRMRLDLSVNILTNHAVNSNEIKVFGGDQQRPNLHIQDMCDLYRMLLALPDEKIAGETFNAGYQNQSIMEIAEIVKKVVGREFPERDEPRIVTTPSNDNRSYRITSDKIAERLGFRPKHSIEDAVRDLCVAFKAGKLPGSMTDEKYHNVKVLKRLGAKLCREKLTAVVTGGAGFIGSHMVDLLLERGYRVRAIDSLVGGRLANVDHHKDNPDFALEERDIRALAPSDPLFAQAKLVFHFAGIGDIVPSIERPTDYMSTNVQGTVQVLEAARHAGVERLVYAASSSCYGLAGVPTREDHPIQPLYPYALSKWMGEQAVFHWHKVYRLPVNSIRIFNAYGPRVRTTGAYGAVFGVFLKQKLAGKPCTVVGDGTQTRDFLFVTDVAAAFLAAAQTQKSGEIWNLGAGKPQSVNRLVELLGCREVVHLPKRPGEPDCTWADTAKIVRDLAWGPKVPFEEGVAKMLADIEAWRDAPLWDTESIAKATQTWFQFMGNE